MITPGKRKRIVGLGIDIGISKFATFSDGYVVANPIFKNHIDIEVMSKKRFKKYREEAYNECFNHIKRYRPAFVTIESIDFSGPNIPDDIKLKSEYLDFDLFFSKLLVLCKSEGIELRKLRKYEKSSKICSACGYEKKNLKLSDRIFICDECFYECDRDLNAAKVIRDKTKYTVL